MLISSTKMLLRNTIQAEIKSSSRIPGFITPHFEKYSLLNLVASIVSLFSKEVHSYCPFPAEVFPEKMTAVNKVVLLVIDSLGYHQLLFLLKEDRNLIFNQLIEKGIFFPITSIFPSTTSSALTSLQTALSPIEHGILGYKIYLQRFGLVANLISFRSAGEENIDLIKCGLEPVQFLGVPTIHQKLAQKGIPSYCFIKKAYQESGLSQMLHTGSTPSIHVSSSDLFVSLRHLLEQNRDRKMLVYTYWDITDEMAHTYGPNSEEFAAEVRNFTYSLEREFLDKLDRGIAEQTLLILTADHGQTEVSEETSVPLTQHPQLMDNLLLPPTGQHRAVYLYTKQGRTEQVRKYLTETFGDAFLILDSERALQEGLFGTNGQPKAETLSRIGDLIVIGTQTHTLFYPYKRSKPKFTSKGHHGGLSEDEMLVPCIVTRLKF
ncbi:MAG: alkaline phosphatase family protein [candidate division KSB1 bacterium]|nr:alkaline phosphatase family protein [candidate division KSB1 bacterium]